MRHTRATLTLVALATLPSFRLPAQSLEALSARLAAATAVSGYEDALADSIAALLPGARRDRLGNVVLTLGFGGPRRLAWCPLDEPGYVVGNITDAGYLRLRRVGRGGPLVDQPLEGHRVTVWGARGAVPGVVGVRSIHLVRARSRTGGPPFTVDDAWVDVGAASRAQVESLGVAVLAPVALAKAPIVYGPGLLAAPVAGRRAACAALVTAARRAQGVRGTVVVGFAVQTLLRNDPGLASLIALHGPFAAVREASVGVALGGTPVETVSLDSVHALATQLEGWLAGGRPPVPQPVAASAASPAPAPAPAAPAGDTGLAETADVLGALVESYGVSGAEAPVRETVRRLLPAWAKPETDTAGNLWLRVGPGRGAPAVVIVAHLDEIGYAVDSIRADGTLALSRRGGFFPSLFEAQPALVHGPRPRGDIPGVFLPRDSGPAPTHFPPPLRVSVGVRDRAAAVALGVAPGQTVTMPKRFVRLAGTRATGRSFDDRVGDASLILAVRHLDRARLKHGVLFLWSTREEIGLEGARAAAAALGSGPARVHAVDTFVSADAPLEPPNFAVAPLGRGPVARALDNSSVTPAASLDTLVRLARARGIPLQVGTTSGGNDGSTFVPYGVVDVPLGWPLRYSHSPAELIDLVDVRGLADLVRAVAEDW